MVSEIQIKPHRVLAIHRSASRAQGQSVQRAKRYHHYSATPAFILTWTALLLCERRVCVCVCVCVSIDFLTTLWSITDFI